MRGEATEGLRLRIVVGEARMREGIPLHRAILERLRAEGAAGATVLKGVAGFGAVGEVHTAMLEVASTDLPVVIEVVDAPARVDALLAALGPLVDGGGVVTVERAAVLRYAPSAP